MIYLEGQDVMFLFVPFYLVMSKAPGTNAAFECASGLWGSQCVQQCGHCEGGDVFCQVYDGLCMNGCAAGYTGKYCKTGCPRGFHGQYCRSACGHCSSGQLVCDPVSGHCLAGCAPGYQLPHCKIPCPFNRWGEHCDSKCECPLVDQNRQCGCHPVTGKCLPCSGNGLPETYFREVGQPECINQFALENAIKEYKPPNVLNIPYMPVLTAVLLIFTFVSTQFLWCTLKTQSIELSPWCGLQTPNELCCHEVYCNATSDMKYFMVRVTKKKTLTPPIERARKPSVVEKKKKDWGFTEEPEGSEVSEEVDLGEHENETEEKLPDTEPTSKED